MHDETKRRSTHSGESTDELVHASSGFAQASAILSDIIRSIVVMIGLPFRNSAKLRKACSRLFWSGWTDQCVHTNTENLPFSEIQYLVSRLLHYRPCRGTSRLKDPSFGYIVVSILLFFNVFFTCQLRFVTVDTAALIYRAAC